MTHARSISLRFDHVLYCMDNETHAHPEWGAYWPPLHPRTGRSRESRRCAHVGFDPFDIGPNCLQIMRNRTDLVDFPAGSLPHGRACDGSRILLPRRVRSLREGRLPRENATLPVFMAQPNTGKHR